MGREGQEVQQGYKVLAPHDDVQQGIAAESDLLSGMERQNREELRVFPREGGDVQDADIMTSLVKYVLDENLAPWELTRKSNDVYVCGRGWIRTDISATMRISTVMC